MIIFYLIILDCLVIYYPIRKIKYFLLEMNMDYTFLGANRHIQIYNNSRSKIMYMKFQILKINEKPQYLRQKFPVVTKT